MTNKDQFMFINKKITTLEHRLVDLEKNLTQELQEKANQKQPLILTHPNKWYGFIAAIAFVSAIVGFGFSRLFI